MQNPVILTGVRANNDLTLGNYFGGMLPIIDMARSRSDTFQINMFIPDLHSFTTPIDHSALYEQVLHTASLYVAAGLPIDIPSIYLYRQSFIPAHSELTWILDNFTGVGQMNRMTQFKDKSAGKEDVSMGLFNYPVLMAADILLYNAQYVPVGDDQTQHLEYTRDIAGRMNARFGDLFTVPEPVKQQHAFFGKDQGLRIMDLVDPTKKMSKSDESAKGVIFLSDTPDSAMKKIMGATTDNVARVQIDRKRQPGITNLLELLALLRGQTIESVAQEFSTSVQYGEFKKVVANEIGEFLRDFQRAVSNVKREDILQTLQRSEQAMNVQANAQLYKVQQAVGLRPKA